MMPEFNEMEPKGTASHLNYYDIEELDAETLEEVEVALYGMIHHASNEEDLINFSIENHTPSASINKPQDEMPDATLCSIPVKINGEETFSHNNVKSADSLIKPQVATQLPESNKHSSPNNLKSADSFTKPQAITQLPESKKYSSPDKISHTTKIEVNPQLNLKKNPYSQRLIIEESRNSSFLQNKKVSTDYEIITLSDEEDSKYASINKAINKGVSKVDYKTFNTNISTPQSVASTTTLSEESDSEESSSEESNFDESNIDERNFEERNFEDSDSDSSIILLNPEPKSCRSFVDSSLDSSDSDIAIISPSKFEISCVDLKLNIIQKDRNNSLELPCVNSTTSNFNWKQYSSTKWTPEMIEFYDKDGVGRDLQGILSSFPKNVKWYLSEEDRKGKSLQRNRYFGSNEKERCLNCNQWGHASKCCKEPKKVSGCSVCGLPGHKQYQCPNKVCLGCGRTSKILIECCPECRRESNIVCMICRSKHVTLRCPDLWRRFHLTTSNQDNPNECKDSLKPKHSLFCCNCAGRGHLVHECPKAIGSKYKPTNPTIYSYKNPKDFLNEITSEGKSSVLVSENRKELWVVAPSADNFSKKGSRHFYYFPLAKPTSENTLTTAKKLVLKDFKHVEISWRKQVKKGRMLVEFTGNGNTKEAKTRFKKIITFQNKAESKSPSRSSTAQENPPLIASTSGKVKSPTKDTAIITAVKINYAGNEGKQTKRYIGVKLTSKEKNNVGKLFGKVQTRHRVQITSCCVGKTWEITIYSEEKGKSFAAFKMIVNYLELIE